jgi:hypothetical protein
MSSTRRRRPANPRDGVIWDRRYLPRLQPAGAQCDVCHSTPSAIPVASGSEVGGRGSLLALSYRKVGNMGIVGILEFHKALARLVEIYVPPVERDYWAY